LKLSEQLHPQSS